MQSGFITLTSDLHTELSLPHTILYSTGSPSHAACGSGCCTLQADSSAAVPVHRARSARAAMAHLEFLDVVPVQPDADARERARDGGSCQLCAVAIHQARQLVDAGGQGIRLALHGSRASLSCCPATKLVLRSKCAMPECDTSELLTR